jgi:hypothetical protein
LEDVRANPEDAARRALHMLAARSERYMIHLVVDVVDLCSQTSIDCWAKIPAIAPCHDAVVTEGMRGLARSPAA